MRKKLRWESLRMRMLLPTVVVMILPDVSFRLAYFYNLISTNIASYMYFVTILAFRCLLRAHVFPSTSLVLGMTRCARSLFPQVFPQTPLRALTTKSRLQQRQTCLSTYFLRKTASEPTSETKKTLAS